MSPFLAMNAQHNCIKCLGIISAVDRHCVEIQNWHEKGKDNLIHNRTGNSKRKRRVSEIDCLT